VIRRRLAVAAVAGVVLTVGTAAATAMDAADAAELATWACAAALVAGVSGALVLVVGRHRPIGAQITVAALTGVAAVAAGAVVAADRMFIASHDLDVLLVVLAASGTVGVLVSMALGERITGASRALGVAARRIGEGEGPVDVGRQATGELAALGRQLEDMGTRLDRARRTERAVETSRRELVAWVSHDLRTPLAGIRALVEALEDGVVDDPDTVARYHRTLRLEADRLALLVDDLFELSSLQAGALQLQLERASLGDLVSDALAASAPVARARGVRLEGRLTEPAPHLALSTPEVARALRNLLENAIRHTPSDGAVLVDVGVADGRAVVSVADACGGIPEADLPRLFDPAFRGQSARTPVTDGGGAGLGLAIVRGIVEAHHGDVIVANEGAGCRFTMRLPLSTSGT
jgi:signal transduction histidine kinase